MRLSILWLLLLCLAAAPAYGGGWATIDVVNRSALARIPPGDHELRVQVLQHGHFPVDDAQVTVTAQQKGLTQAVGAQLAFLEPGPHQHQDGQDHHQTAAHWPKGTEPFYVARVNLAEPGEWTLRVQVQHPLYIERNPIYLTASVVPGAAAVAQVPAAHQRTAQAPPAPAIVPWAVAALALTAAAGALLWRRRPLR